MRRFRDVRPATGREVAKPAVEGGAAFRAVELRGEALDRGPFEVEPALRVAAGREHEQRAAGRGVELVRLDRDVAARDERDRHDGRRKLRIPDRRLQLVEPRIRHSGHATGVLVSRWRRLAGWAIESVVVFVLFIAGLVVGSSLYGDGLFLGFLLALISIWLYFAGLESSERHATLSGRLLGTRVTGLRGEQLTFNRATARHFAMYLSALTPLAAGYLMAFWTKRRQTLHDYLASTIVVKR